MSCSPMVLNCGTCINISVHTSPKTNNLHVAAVSQWPQAAGSLCHSMPKVSDKGAGFTFGLLAARGSVECRCHRQAAETTSSFYNLLGIPESGSHDDIKRAYKQLARKYHPDVSPPDRRKEYTQCFLMVQEAYETLSDPECRALYDRCLIRDLQLGFSSQWRFKEEQDEKNRCKNHWQEQLTELMMRSMAKNSDDNLSWGSRMRRQWADSAHCNN